MKKLLVTFFSINLLACGFQFQGSGSVLPSSIKTVYIKDVINNSTESQAGLLLTEALKDRFDRYGTLQVVESELAADAVLETEIIRFERQSAAVTAATDTALQQDTIMGISAELVSNAGVTLWSNPRITLSQTFGSAANAVVTSAPGFASGGLNASDLGKLNEREIARSQEGQIVEDMTELAAKKIYEQAVLPEF